VAAAFPPKERARRSEQLDAFTGLLAGDAAVLREARARNLARVMESRARLVAESVPGVAVRGRRHAAPRPRGGDRSGLRGRYGCRDAALRHNRARRPSVCPPARRPVRGGATRWRGCCAARGSGRSRCLARHLYSAPGGVALARLRPGMLAFWRQRPDMVGVRYQARNAGADVANVALFLDRCFGDLAVPQEDVRRLDEREALVLVAADRYHLAVAFSFRWAFFDCLSPTICRMDLCE